MSRGVVYPAPSRYAEYLAASTEPDAAFLRPIPGLLALSAVHPGDLVSGRFEILRLLGRGGMGEVFEALDRKLGERVAIKVISREFSLDPGLLERFQREVQIARRISHPNICRIHDLGEHGGMPFLSMELLEGETLAKRLERGPLPLEEWERIARQLFEGLRAAHSVGVVHRDLKPSNLMLVGSRLVILDFGLARPTLTPEDGSLTRTGTLIGTLDWMAPEQLLGEYDERSDLYSAAYILLQAAKGKPEGQQVSGLAGALRRATGDTDFRKVLPKGLQAPWRYVLLRCLERDPARRPARTQDVQELLTQKRSLVFDALRSGSRNRWTRITAATAVLVALIGLGFRYLERPGLQPGSLIMVASTINTTGESQFDGLTSLLRLDLEQSSQFNIWDGQRLGTVLRSMRRDPQSRPEAQDWRQIALREKAPFLVFSTLSRAGDSYELAISAEQIGRAPEAVHSWNHSVTASGPAGVFDAEHEAADWVRSTAGEKAADLSANNRLPQNITTNSWEALHLYDQAQSLSVAGHDGQAIPVFQRAVQLDPQFAMGLMRLGDLLNAQYKSEEGFADWRQAIALAHHQHLSEHERLNIESRYALEIEDFKAAEPVLRNWMLEFPNDPLAPQLLASDLLGQGRYAEATRLGRDEQKRFGPSVFGTSVLIRALAAGNQLADADTEIRVLESLSAHAPALRFRGMVAAMRGDYDQAALRFRELASTAQGEEASHAIGLLAILEADRDRMDEARSILLDGISKDRDAGEYGLASQKTAALAFLEGLRGNRGLARAGAQEAVSIAGPSPQVILESVTVLARNGYADDAARLMKRFPKGEGPGFDAALQRMQGEIAAARGEFQKAVELLDNAARADRPREPKEYLARALDLAGYRKRAKLIYQDIADTPWVVWSSAENGWPGTRFIARKYLRKAKGE